MCRVRERGKPWSWGRWQHQSPVSPSVLNPPRLASLSLAPNSSHLICGESCVKSLRNRLVQTYLGSVVVNYMSQPMQGMQQLRVGRWRGEAWWKLLSPESAWQGMGQLSGHRPQKTVGTKGAGGLCSADCTNTTILHWLTLYCYHPRGGLGIIMSPFKYPWLISVHKVSL